MNAPTVTEEPAVNVLGTLMADAQMVPMAMQAQRALRRAIGWI